MEKKQDIKKWLIGIGIIVIGVIAIMGIFGTRIFSPTIKVNDEKSFSIKGITSLQIDMTKEQIRIIRVQTNEVKIHYHGTSKQDLKLSTETNNGIVNIGSTRTTNLMQENLYVDIYLPEDYNAQLVIHTTSGNVTSEKVHTEATAINTTSGNIFLSDYTGNINLKTSSGSISLSNCTGNINLKTNSGDISATYNTFGEQNINIVTTSGSIQLQLPDAAEFLLDAKTSTGKLHSDFSVEEDNKQMSGQIGAKSNKVVLQTSTGGINLLKGALTQ